MIFNQEKLRKELHIQSLVMEETEIVSFSGFSEIIEIPIMEIKERLDPLDPRIDPYMNNKKNFFYPDMHNKALYIATPLHPLLLFIKAKIFFSSYGYDISILDIHITEILIFFSTGIFFILIFLFIYKKESKEKILGLFMVLPWLPGLLSGDIIVVMSLFLMYPPCFILFEEVFIVFKNRVIFGWKTKKKDTLFPRITILFVMFGISICLTFLQGSSLYNFIFSLIADIFVFSSYIILYFHKDKKKKHRIFEPIPIRLFFKKKYLLAKVKKIPFLLSIGVVIILFSIYYFYRFPFIITNTVYPMRETEDKPITMKNLKGVWEYKKPDYLPEIPDLSDFIVHVAYQEGFLFGTTYTFPFYTEDLRESYYEKESVTGTIMKSQRIVKAYNKRWLKDVLAHLPLNSIENMLICQKKALATAIQPIGFYYQCRYPRIHIISIFILSFFFVFFVDFYLTPSGLYDTKRFAVRRWSKVA